MCASCVMFPLEVKYAFWYNCQEKELIGYTLIVGRRSYDGGKKRTDPETTLLCCDNVLYLFNRNDKRRVPLVCVSRDFGESRSEAMSHDIPYISSKIYSGTLSDGRFF